MNQKRTDNDQPIIVTGAARSGLAIAAGVVHLCGAWGGQIQRPSWKYNMDNPEIRGRLVKPYLHGIGADPGCQNPLPSMGLVNRSAQKISVRWRSGVLAMLTRQGYRGGPWFYKGADAALMWPVWHHAFPEAVWLIVRRDDADVVRSCSKTKYMKGCSDEAGWRRWLDAYKAQFAAMASANLTMLEIWPTRLIDGDVRAASALVDEIPGLVWNADDVADFLAPAMWKHGVYSLTE